MPANGRLDLMQRLKGQRTRDEVTSRCLHIFIPNTEEVGVPVYPNIPPVQLMAYRTESVALIAELISAPCG